MSKIKLDLSKFKKVHADKNSTTLKHEAGHSITINHNALSKENKSHLDSLPMIPQKMAKGGQVKDPTQEHLLPGDKDQNKIDKSVVNKARQKFADGGEIPYDTLIPQEQQQTAQQAAPYGAPSTSMPAPQQPETPAEGSFPIASTPEQAAQGPVAPASPAPLADQPTTQPSTNVNPTPSLTPPSPTPDYTPNFQDAHMKQVEGVTGVAKALGDLGKKQAKIEADSAKQEQTAIDTFKSSTNEIMQERNNLLDDIKNSHIDPNRLYANSDTGSKVSSAIGLILGGLGGALTGHGGNAGLDFLNKQIDRDIDSQKIELGKKENLLSANYHKFGDLAQATTMTKLMMADVVKSQLQAKAAAAQSPLEAARAQQLIGQIDAGMAPAFQALAVQKSLSNGAASGQDPASFVKFVVPEARQAEAFKEIERAQNTRHMGDSIMKAFDQATQENTAAKTGFGMLRTPASVYALHQAMQPTFQDLEGTVRQAAMDNTFTNITPRPGDSEHTIQTKKAALTDYLKSKSSAPVAKGFGIDLDKFRSTSTNPEMQLNPKQQEFATWAKNNPNDPRSQAILKKLGL